MTRKLCAIQLNFRSLQSNFSNEFHERRHCRNLQIIRWLASHPSPPATLSDGEHISESADYSLYHCLNNDFMSCILISIICWRCSCWGLRLVRRRPPLETGLVDFSSRSTWNPLQAKLLRRSRLMRRAFPDNFPSCWSINRKGLTRLLNKSHFQKYPKRASIIRPLISRYWFTANVWCLLPADSREFNWNINRNLSEHKLITHRSL